MAISRSAFILAFPAIALAQSQHYGEFLHFKLPLPPGYSLFQIDRPMMDFDIYELKFNKNIVARVYVGGHPEFKYKPSICTKIDIEPDIIMIEKKHGIEPYEFLLEFNNLRYKDNDFSPWSEIHVFDITQNQDQRKLIINAFKHIKIYKRNIE